MLSAIALTIFMVEAQIPPVVPLPGVKLGLANIVTLFALYYLGTGSAFIILIARCILGAMFAGNASALLFSLLGGVLASLGMVAGSFCRTLGQLYLTAGFITGDCHFILRVTG